MDRLTDDRLDDLIDAMARRMTNGKPQPGLAVSIAGRVASRRPVSAFGWQLASAVVAIVLAVFVTTRLWHEPVRQQATPVAAPVLTRPIRQPATAVASALTPAKPARETPARASHRLQQTIAVERDDHDIPALAVPSPVSIEVAPVVELRIAPLDVKELSVPPLATDTLPRSR